MQNINSVEFRAVIKFLTKRGTNVIEINRCMTDVYGDTKCSSTKNSTVAKWSAEFIRGWDTLQDNLRPVCPANVISQREESVKWKRPVSPPSKMLRTQPSACNVFSLDCFGLQRDYIWIILIDYKPFGTSITGEY